MSNISYVYNAIVEGNYGVAFFLNSISAIVDEFINSFNKKVGNRMKLKDSNKIYSI